MIRTYSELMQLKTFEERFNYLKLDGTVGEDTFGSDRWLNQRFYKDRKWKEIRDYVIVRDLGNDLAMEDHEIIGKIFVHHMNPITKDDILHHYEDIINPEYLICMSKQTHDAIHYGSFESLPKDPIIRTNYDTCPWKRREVNE